MTEQVSFTLRGRNPDVLTCIANLSNDEVFTLPKFANRLFCGASQQALDRGERFETHAYTFIHADNSKTRMAGLFDDMLIKILST